MTELRARRGTTARKSGRAAEVVCAVWLILKGYRLLGFRLRTPMGEIDLLAAKGRTLAVVEVKRRADIASALDAVTYRQRERLRRAAQSIASSRPAFQNADIRLDLIALAPGRWPRHIRDAWRGD